MKAAIFQSLAPNSKMLFLHRYAQVRILADAVRTTAIAKTANTGTRFRRRSQTLHLHCEQDRELVCTSWRLSCLRLRTMS